jgi:hypothetical protein
MKLLEDLCRWEAGDLPREDVLARHGAHDELQVEGIASDLGALLDLHERLSAIGSEPVWYRDVDWQRLRTQLPDRLPRKRARVLHLVGRPLVAASMVVGLSAAAAAASPAVRHEVFAVLRHVTHAVGIGADDRVTSPKVAPTRRDSHAHGAAGASAPRDTESSNDPGTSPVPSDQPTLSQSHTPTSTGGSDGDGESEGGGSGDNSGGENPGQGNSGGGSDGGNSGGGGSSGESSGQGNSGGGGSSGESSGQGNSGGGSGGENSGGGSSVENSGGGNSGGGSGGESSGDENSGGGNSGTGENPGGNDDSSGENPGGGNR